MSSQTRKEPRLFRSASRKMSDCLKQSCREPVMWMLFAVCLVSLFFGKDAAAIGIACAILAVLRCVSCAASLYFSERTDADMEIWDEPHCRVLRPRRNGTSAQLLRMHTRHLQVGDEILLYPGDIVPADAMLLASDRLVVSERPLRADKENAAAVRLAKDARATADGGESIHSPANLVYAGSVVEEGCARARVTAVGQDTHVGAMTGGLAPAHPRRIPDAFVHMRKKLSVWNLILAFLVIPVTVIGILTMQYRVGLLDLLLVSLSLAVLTLGEHVVALCQYVAARQRHTAAHDRDHDNSVHIKTAVAQEKLGVVTDLVLMGSAALHNGIARPTQVIMLDATYKPEESDVSDALRRLGEWLYLYKLAVATEDYPIESDVLPDIPDAMEREEIHAIDGLLSWIKPDTEGLSAYVSGVRRDRAGVVSVSVNATETEDASVMRVIMTNDGSIMDTCTEAVTAEGLVSLRDEDREVLYHTWQEARAMGHRLRFVVTEHGGFRCLEGMLSMLPDVCPKTKGAIRSLERAGIRVISCVRGVSDENVRAFREAGLTDEMPSVRLDSPNQRDGRRYGYRDMMTHVENGVRAFEGCTAEDVLRYVDACRERGGVVAVLSVEGRDMPLLHAADVAVTCAEIPAKGSAGYQFNGTADSTCANDLCRRRADVIVRRSTANGGGVCGVRRALLAARQLRRGLWSAARFVVVSQILRLVAVLVPLCLGLTLFPAVAVMLSGFVFDMAAVFCYAHADVPSEAGNRAGIAAGWTTPVKAYRWDMIVAGVSALLPWIVVAICMHLNVSFGADAAYFGLLSLLCTQLVLLLTGQPPKRSRATFWIVLLLASLILGTLGVALGAGLHLLWCLILPILQPVAFFTGHLLARVATEKNT